MPRVKLVDTDPEIFLSIVQKKTGLTLQELATLCQVHRRSFSDWKHGHCLMPLPVFRKLVKISRMNPPETEVISDYWHIIDAARKGAFTRNKIYGNPGTPEGRSKGGTITCQKFLADSQLAKKVGFGIPQAIHYPKKSPELAELLGLLMGDGGITNYQVRVTLNSETDREYSTYVARSFKRLFHLRSTLRIDKNEKTCEVIVSSKSLVQFLVKLGLKKGNKVKQQIDIPDWIKRSKEFKVACLRGLIDTDGCVYTDIHRIRGKHYFNLGLCFTNYSLPLFSSVKVILEELGYHPTGKSRNISLRREDEIVRYFKEVGPHNPKHRMKFKEFMRSHRKARRITNL